MVDEGGRLVLEALDLIIDLLQCSRCRQHVLAIIARIENGHLGVRRNTCEGKRESGDADGKHFAEAMNGHREVSSVVVSISAAQSRPLPRSHAVAKPSAPQVATVSAIAISSVLEDAAVKASATSERPSSNSRLPRRDWQ